MDSRTYEIGASHLVVRFGDITTSQARVLVSSDDYFLTMGGRGVAATIRATGGNAIVQDAAKMKPLGLGDVVVTTAGNLPAWYIFHAAVTVPPRARRLEQVPAGLVEQVTRRCMDLLDSLHLPSIAFPALGMGYAGRTVEDVAAQMAQALAEHLRSCQSAHEVILYLYNGPARPRDRLDYEHFFEELDRRTPGLPSPISDTESSRPGVQVFYSYAREDEMLLKELRGHLAPLRNAKKIEDWHDRNIPAGDEWAGSIDTHLEAASIILLLVSADFMDSRYIFDVEMRRALERHRSGEARVIPIIVRPVDWTDAPFAKLQALPTDGKPVTTWPNRDAAWLDVVQGIREQVEARRVNVPP